jgi:hypothetical protein
MITHFSPDECQRIIGYTHANSLTHSSNLFSNSGIDYNYFVIKRDELSQWIFDKFKDYVDLLYPDNTANLMNEVYLHKYTEGCKFSRHRDDIKYPDQVLNVGVTLNSSYKGGKFIAYDKNRELGTNLGEFYHMTADTEHEILEITNGIRYSLIQFFTYKELLKQSAI